MKGCDLSSAKSRNLSSAGKTTFPRSGRSFLLNSAHCIAIFARTMASSTGQSGTVGSSMLANVPFSIKCSAWCAKPMGGLAVSSWRSTIPRE
ncbi:hypothetical protein BVRB_7g177910 [Beta vulgaris subsp. vulgaris]|nr:hypothetical protein BVRB_7g177910 [Beta vulgaris subsp. vulgaris]